MVETTVSPLDFKAINDKLGKLEILIKNKTFLTDDPLLTTENVLNYLSISRRSLQSYRDNQLLEYSVVQGKFFYRLSAINSMIDKHLVKVAD